MRSVTLLLAATSLAAPTLGYPCGAFVSSITKSVSWYTGYGDIQVPKHVPNTRDEYPDTVYRVLKGKEEFSMLVKGIEKFDDLLQLLDSDRMVTIFAPTNDALTNIPNYNWQGSHDNEKEREKIMKDTISYHIIPGVIESRLFGQNSTIATGLHARDGSFDDANRRLKITTSVLPPWKTQINNYVTITESDIHAKNGVIHAVDSPIFLPPDIMDLVYMLPSEFSISAMALLKTNLQHNLEFNSGYKKKGGQKHLGQHNDRHGKGSPLSTVFVPTNEAWEKLPSDLKLFLFSPAGERSLRKLLAFHTIPDTVVFSEWGRSTKKHHSNTHSNNPFTAASSDVDLSFEWDKHFDTLIEQQQMPVHVKKSESKLPGSHVYNFELQAHGVYATMIDNPAQNGAFHVVGQVLSPRSVEGVDEERNQKDWEEWREWFTDWSFEHTESDSK